MILTCGGVDLEVGDGVLSDLSEMSQGFVNRVRARYCFSLHLQMHPPSTARINTTVNT